MIPLHQIQVVDDAVEQPHCVESSSSEDDVEVESSNGNIRAAETASSSSRQSLRGDVTFPIKLHEMLMDVEREDNSTIVSWSPDGKGFRVHKQTLFVETILPRYFSQTKYRSFQRQLNHYGFDRIIKGPYEGGYRHPDFARDDPIRCRSMRRLKKHVTPKRVPLNETPSRHNGICSQGNDKVIAVSPEPSHHGSPKQDFESRKECFSGFPSPMFRPVPQHHRARIVTGTPLPVHPPGSRTYYPPPSQPHVTHVYYIPPPPEFHHQSSSYRIEYRPAAVVPARQMYQAYHAKANVPIMNPMSPHNQVHLPPAHEEILGNPEPFVLSSPRPTTMSPMGMVPVEEVGALTEPERPAILSEPCKSSRRKRLSFSSVNSNQEKFMDDLLLDFLSEDEQQEGTDDDDVEILNRWTDENTVLYRNPQSQFVDPNQVCYFSHDFVPNLNGFAHQANPHPPLVSTEAPQTVAL